MRALLIKMSSMGDILHTFPALTDLQHHRPDLVLDWVVEQSFADMAGWHPAVNQIIPIRQRAWLRNRNRESWQQWRAWRQGLRQHSYDLTLDAQGLFKSAVVAAQAKAQTRAGFGGRSLRETPAVLLLNQRHDIIGADEQPHQVHAVERIRRLFGAVFDYPVSGEPQFGVREQFVAEGGTTKAPVLLIPGTTWHTKHWVPEHWNNLARELDNSGYPIEIIWGSPAEHTMAQRIQQQVPNATVSDDRLSIPEVTRRLANARAVIGTDTGFTHIAGALGTPSIALYGPTSPDQVGLIGSHTRNMTQQLECSPCHKRACKWLPKDSTEPPPCMLQLEPQRVFSTLQSLL